MSLDRFEDCKKCAGEGWLSLCDAMVCEECHGIGILNSSLSKCTHGEIMDIIYEEMNKLEDNCKVQDIHVQADQLLCLFITSLHLSDDQLHITDMPGKIVALFNKIS